MKPNEIDIGKDAKYGRLHLSPSQMFWNWVFAWCSLANNILLILTLGILDLECGIGWVYEKISRDYHRLWIPLRRKNERTERI